MARSGAGVPSEREVQVDAVGELRVLQLDDEGPRYAEVCPSSEPMPHFQSADSPLGALLSRRDDQGGARRNDAPRWRLEPRLE